MPVLNLYDYVFIKLQKNIHNCFQKQKYYYMKAIYPYLLALLVMQTYCFGWLHAAIPETQQITHVFILPNDLFYISKSGRYFGFAAIKTGQLTTPHQLQEHEATIRIDKKDKSIVMRKQRDQVFLFNLTLQHIEQLYVELPFKHQHIRDAIFLQEQTIVMTEKDIRLYPKSQSTYDTPKRVFNSAKKYQTFKKIFLEKEQSLNDLLLVFTQKEKICIRTFKNSKKGIDLCLIQSKSIKSIQKAENYLIIQSQNQNFVIADDLQTVFTFKGKSRQIQKNYIVLQNFMTFSLTKQQYFDRIAVYSLSERQLWLFKDQQEDKLYLSQDDIILGQIRSDELPLRSWMELCQSQCDFRLVLQYSKNFLVMYQFILSQTPPLQRVWPNKEAEDRYIQELHINQSQLQQEKESKISDEL